MRGSWGRGTTGWAPTRARFLSGQPHDACGPQWGWYGEVGPWWGQGVPDGVAPRVRGRPRGAGLDSSPPPPGLTQSALATSSMSEPAQSCPRRGCESHLPGKAGGWALRLARSRAPPQLPTPDSLNPLTAPGRPASCRVQPPPPSPSPATPGAGGGSEASHAGRLG